MPKNIVRYSNRKLYDKDNSRYVTLTELVKQPIGSFTVLDHVTKEDVTTEILLNSLSTEAPNEAKVRVMQHLTTVLSQ
jgi:polyhydroxyalkanoate synthesis regulator protein